MADINRGRRASSEAVGGSGVAEAVD